MDLFFFSLSNREASALTGCCVLHLMSGDSWDLGGSQLLLEHLIPSLRLYQLPAQMGGLSSAFFLIEIT